MIVVLRLLHLSELEQALDKLKPGEISEPVKSVFGFHIIKLEEVKEARVKPLDEVKEEITKASLAAAFENNYPIAFWRLPNTGEIHVVVSFDQIQKLAKVDFEELEKGFVISPFDNVNRPHLFIRSSLHIAFDFDEVSCHFDFNKEKPSHQEELFIDSFFNRLDTPENYKNYHIFS